MNVAADDMIFPGRYFWSAFYLPKKNSIHLCKVMDFPYGVLQKLYSTLSQLKIWLYCQFFVILYTKMRVIIIKIIVIKIHITVHLTNFKIAMFKVTKKLVILMFLHFINLLIINIVIYFTLHLIHCFGDHIIIIQLLKGFWIIKQFTPIFII